MLHTAENDGMGYFVGILLRSAKICKSYGCVCVWCVNLAASRGIVHTCIASSRTHRSGRHTARIACGMHSPDHIQPHTHMRTCVLHIYIVIVCVRVFAFCGRARERNVAQTMNGDYY